MSDLIRREDAIAVVADYFDTIGFARRYAKALINKVPSAERKGEWIYCEDDVAMCDGYRCDKCGFFVPWDYEHKFIDFINDYHFCPNCGAKMKGAEDGR